MKQAIFIDSNAIIGSNYLRSSATETFLRLTKLLSSNVYIPDIVIDESLEKYRGNLEESFKKYKAALNELLKLTQIEYTEFNLDVSDQKSQLAVHFKSLCESNNIVAPVINGYF